MVCTRRWGLVRRAGPWLAVGVALGGVLASGCADGGGERGDAGGPGHAAAGVEDTALNETTDGVLGHRMRLIDGTERDLGEYRGDVVLVVNVASRCGMTPQYEGLQSLYESRREQGFVVLGFPANDFRGQEPGSNEEIAAFCRENYGVTFPMFEKISVVGEGRHPLFAKLAELSEEPTWNFTKYLIDREGRLVGRFDPRTPPEDPALVGKVDELLAGG